MNFKTAPFIIPLLLLSTSFVFSQEGNEIALAQKEKKEVITIETDTIIPVKRKPVKMDHSIVTHTLQKINTNKITSYKNTADVPFASIEVAPIYPGCENAEGNFNAKKCTTEKVQKHVQRSFDVNLASEIGIRGRQRISIQFKINTEGEAVNIKARASHPKLEKEAIRVIKSLRTMIPGKQGGQLANTMYSMPILFQIVD
jgi:hypothetical protein